MEMSYSFVVNQGHRSVCRRNFQFSKEEKARKDYQSEEKEHLNVWVRNENVKSQERDKEDSKKRTTLSEESFQDNPLSANVVVESGQNCRSKVGK